MDWHKEVDERRVRRFERREERRQAESERIQEGFGAVIFGLLLYLIMFYGSALCY